MCAYACDVLVLGIANLIADGISMGFGDFVSRSTEKDVAVKERSVTQWDFKNHRTTQKEQLIQRYQLLGMNATDATLVVNTFAKYPDILVDETLVAEKGMVAPDQSEKPWKNGLITFVAFVVFGSVPILAFIVLIPFTNSDKIKFIGACVLSAVALALLGIAKAKIAAQNYAASMGITLVNGLIAASAAYGIGWTLRNVAGLEQ